MAGEFKGPVSNAALRYDVRQEITMQSIKSLFSLLLIIAVLVFAIQNIAAIKVQFLVWSFSLPSALLILLLLCIGFLLGVLFYSLLLNRRRRR